MVRRAGLEPAATSISDWHSDQTELPPYGVGFCICCLQRHDSARSFHPLAFLVGVPGIAPETPAYETGGITTPPHPSKTLIHCGLIPNDGLDIVL